MGNVPCKTSTGRVAFHGGKGARARSRQRGRRTAGRCSGAAAATASNSVQQLKNPGIRSGSHDPWCHQPQAEVGMSSETKIMRRRTVVDAMEDLARWVVRHPAFTLAVLVVAAVVENFRG